MRAKVAAFTLIEVLAALVIVALGMMGVIQAVGQTASNSAYLRDKTVAHWVAMNRLTEARLQRAAPKIDKSSDEVEMAGRRWRWTMTVTQTPVESMRRIDIGVRLAEAPEGTSLASVTGFYGTAVGAPGSVAIAWQGTIGGPPSDPGTEGDPQNPGNNPPQNDPPNPPPTDDDPPEDPPEPPEPGE